MLHGFHVNLLAAALVLAASACAAQTDPADDSQAALECPDLGLESGFLTEYFCGQFSAIGQDGGTRTVDPNDDPLPTGPEFDWLDQPLLRDAYRVDPRKTLDLINRIRAAGGLPES